MVDGTLPQERCDFYVYVIFRLTGEPCYVGKGRKARVNRYFWQDCHNKYLARIIAKAGGILPFVKIREGLTNSQALETEVAFIAALGRKIDGGVLVNFTLGGDGCLGAPVSDKTREVLSKINKGKKHPPAFAEKIREVSLKQWADPDYRRRHAEAVSRPEARKRLSEGRLGMQFSESHRESLRRSHAGQKQSEANKAALRLANTGRPMSDQTKAKMAATRKQNEARKLSERLGTECPRRLQKMG